MNLVETQFVGIQLITDLLNFKNNDQGFNTGFEKILTEYKRLAFDKLEKFNNSVRVVNPDIYKEIERRWCLFDADQQEELVMSPQISNIFYWFKPDRISDIGGILIEALDAELAKQSQKFDTKKYNSLWTSNGDYFIKYDSEKDGFVDFEAFRLENDIVLDFFSPFIHNITDADSIISQSNQIYNYNEAIEVCEKFDRAMQPILSKPNNINRFIKEILNVIVFKKRASEDGKRHFVCGSNYNYMGRLLIVNPELAKDEDLIDALVHESIHFLLDMIDEINGWIPNEINTAEQRIKMNSKWSGRPLALRTFLHAVFVWYGLFNLWIYALKNGLYDKSYAIEKIDFIKKGFEKLEIEEFSEFNVSFSKELLNTIDTARNEVLSTKY